MLKVLILSFLNLYNNLLGQSDTANNIPLVVTTWDFVNSTIAAYEVLNRGGSALDAVEQGVSVCEEQQCHGTVGYGGNPDERGETTLDALIMDGRTMNVGAVAGLRRIKSAISVARHVFNYTAHSILVGDQATQFAVQMGFHEESLTTNDSKQIWEQWRSEQHCQPNYWLDVVPNPKTFCGPYRKSLKGQINKNCKTQRKIDRFNHDTIGMVAIDKNGDIAAGTSTNGVKFKIPGRVGDSPIPGSGGYADNAVGAAAVTGDGDVLLRFLPSFVAVEEMRRGATPTEATQIALQRVIAFYPKFMGAVVALRKDGQYGAACHGMGGEPFPFVVQDKTLNNYKIFKVVCS